QHEQFVNLRLVRKLSYVEYLGECTRFADIPAQAKKDPRYAEYLRSMRTYFEGFFARAMPLFNLPEEQREAARVFDREWAPPSDGALFCAPCQRQFEKETTYAAHMGSRKHQRTVARAESSDNVGQQPTRDRDAEQRDLAWHEHLITRYAATLADRLLDTRANITRRQALTEDERAHELHDADDDELLAAADDDGAGEQLYNPLNLPLGWDGKPIPFWLYKLHGLGVTFTCEICGNSVYRGRKAYERHFQEPRHATNMRRLGIPNTRQFHGVAGIDEALELWARVDKEKRQTSVNADTFEEYEDSEGNVFSKKTYFDLKRQGLI
ncbi:Pre-mRNA-splicing factor sap61, partial [Coemansia erecta]